MSVLRTPRLILRGHTIWNPCTVNNLRKRHYDKDLVELTSGTTDDRDDYWSWLRASNDETGDPNGGWNVYGDHSATFQSATITAVDLGDGLETNDPIIGKMVMLIGDLDSKAKPRLVDVDPFNGDTTSQIFLRGFIIGDTHSGVFVEAMSRLYCRWPNKQRNLASGSFLATTGVLWQTVGQKVRWGDDTDQSPALQKLRCAVAKEGSGVMLRFASYATTYYQAADCSTIKDGPSLAAAYRNGFRGDNPARSALIGTIGVWEGDELMTAPTDRMLRPSAAVRGTNGLHLGPASVRVDPDRKVVVLDLLSTFPEADYCLKKAELGSFQLEAYDPSDSANSQRIGVPLSYEQYNQQQYERAGGIVEIDVPDKFVKFAQDDDWLLRLMAEDQGQPVLDEAAVIVETDNRGVYLDDGDDGIIRLRAYRRGKTAPGIKISVAQYFGETEDDKLLWHFSDGPANSHVALPKQEVITGTDGYANLPVKAIKPGNSILVFYPGGFTDDYKEDIAMVARSSAFYACIRVFPRISADDPIWEKYRSQTLDWNDVYHHVLKVFDFVYPIMSRHRDLSSGEQWIGEGPIVKKFTDLASIDEAFYMPITRDLSEDRREILQAYFKQNAKKNNRQNN